MRLDDQTQLEMVDGLLQIAQLHVALAFQVLDFRQFSHVVRHEGVDNFKAVAVSMKFIEAFRDIVDEIDLRLAASHENQLLQVLQSFGLEVHFDLPFDLGQLGFHSLKLQNFS